MNDLLADGSGPRGEIVILGVGNVLLGDEGAGVHVTRALEGDARLPAVVRVVDGGTLGLELLPIVQDAAGVILVDAVDLGAEPGVVRLLDGEALAGAFGGHVSAHQAGAADLIAAARLCGFLPVATALVGIQPGPFAWSLDLSPAVREATGRAAELVVAAARRFAGVG